MDIELYGPRVLHCTLQYRAIGKKKPLAVTSVSRHPLLLTLSVTAKFHVLGGRKERREGEKGGESSNETEGEQRSRGVGGDGK
jgi:hypothetical protein